MNPHQVSECWSAVKPTHSTSEQQQQQQLVPLHKSVLSLLLVLALYTHRASLPVFAVFMYCLGCALGPCCVYMYSAVSPLLPFVTACSIARQADRLQAPRPRSAKAMRVSGLYSHPISLYPFVYIEPSGTTPRHKSSLFLGRRGSLQLGLVG